MALLVIAPFIVGFVVALFRIFTFPFGGSRHQTYLLPFLAAGISAAFAWVPRRRAVPIFAIGCPVAHHSGSSTPRPRMTCGLCLLRDMTAAISYIGRVAPPGAPLFADDMTRDVLRYYLSRNDRALDIAFEEGPEGIPRRPLVSSSLRQLSQAFRPADAIEEVTDAARMIGVPPRDPLRVVSVAWKEPALGSRLSPEENQEVKEFGLITVITIPTQTR